MCYATKRKIADCVKRLMHRKDISKITIQDIMDETNMSRQSFYYHFKDIYDVLEWIGVNDFQKQLSGADYDNMEDWICGLLEVLRREHSFYEKMVDEIEWPKIVKCVKKPIEEQVTQIFSKGDTAFVRSHQEEWNACIEFFSTSFCYYVLDHIYRRRKIADQKVISDLRFIMAMLEGSELVPEEKKVAIFPKVIAL